VVSEVLIDGDRYIKAPPVSTSDTSTIERVLGCPIECEGGLSTIREYLYDLLLKLWEEGEGFSGKRPFGNSGWEFGICIALAKAGIVDALFDEDGRLDEMPDEERMKAEALITDAIAYVFFGDN